MNYPRQTSISHIISPFFLLCSLVPTVSDGFATPTISFTPRSQGRDKVMQIVGMAEHTHLFDMESWYGILSLTPEYTRSFRSSNIARSLFGPYIIDSDAPEGSSLLIQGSTVLGRNPNALLADYFYLPSDFDSIVFMRPQIINGLLNIDFYFGLDEWVDGLYVRIYGPYVHTKWRLQLQERVNNEGVEAFAAGEFTQTPLARSSLLPNFLSYASGSAPGATIGTGPATAHTQATTFDPLCFAQLITEGEAENSFADLWIELGWNFCNNDYSHLGLNAQMAFPTGHMKKTHLLFSPKIGDAKWQLGMGMTGHYILWHSHCSDTIFGIYLDANVTHLFLREEREVFDLKNKPLSRYMLAEKFGPNTQNLTGMNGVAFTPADVQFAYELSPVANLTNRKAKIGYSAQADIVCWFNICYQGFSWDLGYNFWVRSRQRIKCITLCSTELNGATWGLKGDAQIFGFATANDPLFNQFDAIPLSATESGATITAGTNGTVVSPANSGVDKPQPAFAGTTNVALASQPLLPPNLIQTSIQPILLSESDLDFRPAGRSLSHKFFTHLQYTFDQECWVPYLGIGGFAEFGDQHRRSDNIQVIGTNTITRSRGNALSQWAVWVKGGIAFN